MTWPHADITCSPPLLYSLHACRTLIQTFFGENRGQIIDVDAIAQTCVYLVGVCRCQISIAMIAAFCGRGSHKFSSPNLLATVIPTANQCSATAAAKQTIGSPIPGVTPIFRSSHKESALIMLITSNSTFAGIFAGCQRHCALKRNSSGAFPA